VPLNGLQAVGASVGVAELNTFGKRLHWGRSTTFSMTSEQIHESQLQAHRQIVPVNFHGGRESAHYLMTYCVGGVNVIPGSRPLAGIPAKTFKSRVKNTCMPNSGTLLVVRTKT